MFGLSLYVHTITTLQQLVSRAAARRGEQGQAAAEYVGILVVVAAIVAALSTMNIGNTLKTAVTTALGKIT